MPTRHVYILSLAAAAHPLSCGQPWAASALPLAQAGARAVPAPFDDPQATTQQLGCILGAPPPLPQQQQQRLR